MAYNSVYEETEDQNEVSKLSKAQRAQLASHYAKKWDSADAEWREILSESRDSWDYYLKNQPRVTPAVKEKNPKKSSGGFRLGVIPRAVDSQLSSLHNAIFPSDEGFFRATPQNDVSREFQELYEKNLYDRLNQKNFIEETRRYLLTLCLDQLAAACVHWEVRKRDKVVYEPKKFNIMGVEIPVPALGIKRTVKKDFIEWEGTTFKPLDLNDWRCDLYARSFEDSWFMRRWYEPIWKVKREYDLKEVHPYHAISKQFNDNNSIGNFKELASGLTFPNSTTNEKEGEAAALLVSVYDNFVIDGELYEDYTAVILNWSEVIYFGKNPYDHGRKPFIVHSLLPIPNQLNGVSLIKHALPSAALIDGIVQQIMHIGNFASKPIFEVNSRDPAFRKERRIDAGMTVPVMQVGNTIRQVPINVQNLTILDSLISRAEENIKQVTGASNMLAGDDFLGQPANITAFQVDQHVQGSSNRSQSIIRNFLNNVLEPFLTMAFENDRQFKEKTEYVLTGTEQKELTPTVIKQLDYKWSMTGANAAQSKGKRLANLNFFLNQMAPQMLQAGILTLDQNKQLVLDQEAAIRQLFVLSGETGSDSYLKSVPVQSQEGINGLSQDGVGAAAGLPSPVAPGGQV